MWRSARATWADCLRAARAADLSAFDRADDLIQSGSVTKRTLVDTLWLCSALLVLIGTRWCRSKWALVLWWAMGGVVMTAGGGRLLFG